MKRKDAIPAVTMRVTETGDLKTTIVTVDAPLRLELDGQEIFTVEPGTQIMVIRHNGSAYDLLERLLDWVELGLHAGYSSRVNGDEIRTKYDIRLLDGRKYTVGDVIPF